VGREDLSSALYGLVCRDEPPEHILIELSGLADPVPVAQQLLTTEWRGLLDLDGIVAVADALNLRQTMEEAPEGKSQLAYASVVVLNKGDLAEPSRVEAAEKLIEELNPMAEIIKTSRAEVGTEDVIGLGAFSSDWKPKGHKLAHGKGVSSVTLRAERPLRIEEWVSFHRRMMIRREGIYRAKGILRFEGMDEPMLLQAVRGLYTFETYEGKHDGGSELVVIGKNLDEAEYRKEFEKLASLDSF
jgi:G3E family GTPase